MGVLDWLFGRSEPPSKAIDLPRATGYPNEDDVNFARMQDATYGDPMAGQLQQGARGSPLKTTQQMAGRLTPPAPEGMRQELSYPQLQALYAAWLAAQRSPLAALGFDPSRAVVADKGPTMTIAGTYTPSSDRIYADLRVSPALTHENTHRGMQQLRQSGVDAPSGGDEERAVRALMLRNYGDVESQYGSAGAKQVDTARAFMKDRQFSEALDRYEQAAAEEYQRRNRKMGPR